LSFFFQQCCVPAQFIIEIKNSFVRLGSQSVTRMLFMPTTFKVVISSATCNSQCLGNCAALPAPLRWKRASILKRDNIPALTTKPAHLGGVAVTTNSGRDRFLY
jgi:hypothetical protein